MRAQKKLCCSKKIILASFVITVLLTLATVLGTFLTNKDMMALATVTGLSWGETSAATAFYYWKAKNENRIKLTLGMVKELADKYGIEAVVSLTGITLRD